MSLSLQKLYGVPLALILSTTTVFALSLLQSASQEGPTQPIEFSHPVHVRDNNIACSYCHSGVTRSTAAGVPSVAACYECHRGVKLRNDEIEKVLSAWQNKQPIRWVLIHSVPDHVYFSHKRHTVAGVECQECHGDVASMRRVAQVSDLSMGWCLNCHQQRNAAIECSTCHK